MGRRRPRIIDLRLGPASVTGWAKSVDGADEDLWTLSMNVVTALDVIDQGITTEKRVDARRVTIVHGAEQHAAIIIVAPHVRRMGGMQENRRATHSPQRLSLI